MHIVLLKCPYVQIAFLKFTSCDNQALVGCIPIAAVAVHLNLKSFKLVSHLIKCIAITEFSRVYGNFKCLYKKKVWNLIECTAYHKTQFTKVRLINVHTQKLYFSFNLAKKLLYFEVIFVYYSLVLFLFCFMTYQPLLVILCEINFIHKNCSISNNSV